jgi:hypothetical protein
MKQWSFVLLIFYFIMILLNNSFIKSHSTHTYWVNVIFLMNTIACFFLEANREKVTKEVNTIPFWFYRDTSFTGHSLFHLLFKMNVLQSLKWNYPSSLWNVCFHLMYFCLLKMKGSSHIHGNTYLSSFGDFYASYLLIN